MAQQDSSLTAGAFSPEGNNPNSASNLDYQEYTMGLTARGSALGRGLRVAPPPGVQFSNPPVSGSQFGSSSNARSLREEAANG